MLLGASQTCHLDIELIVAGDGPLQSARSGSTRAGSAGRFVGEVLVVTSDSFAAADLLVLPSLAIARWQDRRRRW